MRHHRRDPLAAARRPSRARSAIGLLGLLTLTACPEGLARLGCATDGATGASPVDEDSKIEGLASLSLVNATTSRRHVALVNKAAGAPCPLTKGWTATPLFRSGDVVKLLEAKTLPTPLERFCVYTWNGASAPTKAPIFAPADNVVRVDPDQEIVVPQTTAPRLADDPGLRAALRDAFLGAAGALPNAPMDPAIHAGTEGPARIAVIDTVDFAGGATAIVGATPHLRHGLAVAEIVRELRCPGGQASCRDKLFHAQAFPYASTSAPLPQAGGGPLGSLASLAHAIGEALIRWQSGDMRTSPLILNLSLGWDPRFGADLTDPGLENQHPDLLSSPSAAVPVTIQAVHAALSYASCLDVLVIASSGNRSTGACDERGGLAPAIWERYPAVDPVICAALFGALPAPRPGDPGAPPTTPSLVYAAGGVDGHGAPIALTRAESLPRRLLPADHALVGAGNQETGSWTGTSVSAASLSAIAGLLWSRHRVLTSHQLMAVIDQSGTPTSYPVSIGPSSNGVAAQISAEAAYARICALRGGACQNPYKAAGVPASVASRLDAPILAALANAPDSPAQPVTLTCSQGQVSCGAGSQTMTRCEAQGVAAAAGPPLIDPWVRPQPDIPICPDCPIRGGKLLLSLNPDHTGGAVTIQNPLLELQLTNGSLVRGTLANVTVGATEVQVDLSRYRVTVGTTVTTLADLSNQARGGSLEFTVSDPTGAPSRLVSTVSLP